MELSPEERAEVEQKYEELKNNRFKQQRLRAWRPVPSFGSTMITFGIFGIMFISLGITLYVLSDQVQQISYQYSNDSDCWQTEQYANYSICQPEITISEEIVAPIYVYYQLDNFYQNHRRYVRSRSYSQLKGMSPSTKELSDDCTPVWLNSQLAPYITTSVSGKALVGSDHANPCGLIARSYFSDKFALYGPFTNEQLNTYDAACCGYNSTSASMFKGVDCTADNMDTKCDATVQNARVAFDEQNIAWKADTSKFINNQDAADWQDVQWTNVEDPHFIVWMRTAGLPNFRKLYAVVDQNLAAGKYQLVIDSAYDVATFKGSKSFVLSTTNALGGQNYFMAIAYIVVGSLCIVFSVIFFGAFMSRKSAHEALGDQGVSN